MKTLKVKPWGEGQGDHVLIDESDFNPEFHVLLDAVTKAPDAPKAKVKPEPTAKSAD